MMFRSNPPTSMDRTTCVTLKFWFTREFIWECVSMQYVRSNTYHMRRVRFGAHATIRGVRYEPVAVLGKCRAAEPLARICKQHLEVLVQRLDLRLVNESRAAAGHQF